MPPGRTALVGEALRRTSGLVFRSRCRPREHVPFNALDGLIDGVAVSEPNVNPRPSKVAIQQGNGPTLNETGRPLYDYVTLINLFDYGNGEAGNGPTPPPNFTRDIWSAEWDSGTQTFTAFTKVVDG